MALSEDQIAKIILIRSVEESDPRALPQSNSGEAFDGTGQVHVGVDWLEKRASYLFERLSTRYQLLIELARVPAQWSVPLYLIAFVGGVASNLLGPTAEIHVVRNPVFLLVLWNLGVYTCLLLFRFLPRQRLSTGAADLSSGSKEQAILIDRVARAGSKFTPSWPLRFVMPRLWRFFQCLTVGFGEPKAYGEVLSRFNSNWLQVGAPLSTARWRVSLHVGALMIAIGAIGGMYCRGLFYDYRVSWASTFITREQSVEWLVKVVFGPSLFVSKMLGLDLAQQISVARLFTAEGDAAEGWIHLFAITVVLGIVIPRTLLALWQWQKISRFRRGMNLPLDGYYGRLIESPIRSVIDKQIEIGAARFAYDVAKFVGDALYKRRIVPPLRAFRQQGGKIADLKLELHRTAAAFLPELESYITATAAPAFQKDLAARAGELINSIGAEFTISKPAIAFNGVRIDTMERAQAGIADVVSAAIGVSVAASISLTFATVGGGLGSELGIAIISTLLGTTGPVGFVIGLVAGAIAAAAAWWFGKDSIAAAVNNLRLPAAVVKTALWESRFQRLIDQGHAQCEESVRVEVGKRLTTLQPEIAEGIMSKARSLWTSSP